MTPPEEESLWRNRFILVNLVRIGGTLFVLFALALWHSDLIVEGGSILGLPLAILGLIVSFGGPAFLARYWRSHPGP